MFPHKCFDDRMNALASAVSLRVRNDWGYEENVHMIARARLEPRFREWNRLWRAPSGSLTAKKVIPKRLWGTAAGARAVGMFAFQPSNSNRRFEYPWAFYASEVQSGMRVLDLGGGVSGFPFVLSKCGTEAYIVDPFYDYGGPTDYSDDPKNLVSVLNGSFGTHVLLKRCTIDRAGFEPESFDRIFCISALEHFPTDAIDLVAREVPRLLKSGGRFIATVDLFLNLAPFTTRQTNEFGRNISIRSLIETCGLGLVRGEPSELVGYQEFAPDAILSRLEAYQLSTAYPVLTQAFVLEKSP